MAKVPATPEGLRAIETLLKEETPINATEVMAVRQALDVVSVYQKAVSKMEKAPVTYYSHISGILDEYLKNTVEQNNIDIEPDILWQAGIACAKKTHEWTKALCPQIGFIGGGARGLHHFTEMVGADACITINWKGTAEDLIQANPVVIDRFHAPVPVNVLDTLAAKIPDFKKAYFRDAILPEEYEEFGPVVLFRKSFETAWQGALDHIKEV
jgi:transaldolase